MITWCDLAMSQELKGWADFANTPYQDVYMHLFTNQNVQIAYDMSLLAFVEATFPGYAALALNGWADPVKDAANKLWYSQANPVRFCRTAAGVAETVYGFFLTDPTASTLYAAEKTWPNGIIFATECDCVSVQVRKTEKAETPSQVLVVGG